MSYYVKPKFQVGDQIYTIYNDNIEKINIISIQAHSVNEKVFISYLSDKNLLAREDQSFKTKEEAELFLKESLRIPFLHKAWHATSTGINLKSIDSATFYYKEDTKPYNYTFQIKGFSFNETSCYEHLDDAIRDIKKYTYGVRSL